MRKYLIATCLAAILLLPLEAQKKLSPAEAKDHFGETDCLRQCRQHAICGFNKRAANVPQPGQGIPESTLHRCDLGKQSEQVWKAGGRV